MPGVVFLLAFLAPQLAGVLVVLRLRQRLLSAALVAPLLSAFLFLVLAYFYWSSEASVVTAARGSPPCGAFGALSILSTLGGAFAHFVMTTSVVAAVAIGRRLRRPT